MRAQPLEKSGKDWTGVDRTGMDWKRVLGILTVAGLMGLQQGCASILGKGSSSSQQKAVYAEGEADYSRVKGFAYILEKLNFSDNEPELSAENKFDSRRSGDKSRKAVLYRQFHEWKGTKYRLGGMSKKGVDCSAFVQLTYKSKFGINLPRTTRIQSTRGVPIPEQKLETGDLVFFKTGVNDQHVGIFLEDRKFLHASSSKGVMISSLDDSYWSRKFWTARRIN